MEEWISLQEFMRRKKVGQEVAYQMLHSGKYEYEKTAGGRYKIKVGGDTVPRARYEELLQENAELKTKLESVKLLVS
ncbi:MAG: hypothetical protein IJ220_00795 [Clostridia bacterium]|nr:hypothetical protein [Clostridia bacterium]